MSRLGEFYIGEVKYDLDDLTLDEMEEVETLAGASFSEINYASAKGLKAFTFVLMKRNNPNITMEEIGQVKVAAFVEPEERMPELPPEGPGDPENPSQAESPQDDTGPQPSVASTDG
jgi:hypothetical protein